MKPKLPYLRSIYGEDFKTDYKVGDRVVVQIETRKEESGTITEILPFDDGGPSRYRVLLDGPPPHIQDTHPWWFVKTNGLDKVLDGL